MLILNFHSLYSKISHIFWRKDRELELEFDFYCHFYNMTWLKFQISRIRIYYFRWFQLDMETLKMSQGFCLYLSDSRVWLLKKSMPCCCHDSSSRWLQTIFPLVAPPCCVTVLIHGLYCSTFYLPQTSWGTETFYDCGQAETDSHAPAHTCMHNPPGHTFTISQFTMIFSTVVNQFWTPTEANRLPDKWTRTAHTQQSVQRQPYTYHTHSRACVPPWRLRLGKTPYITGGCMNGTTACALAAQTQSHLVSLTGHPKGSDSLLAVIGVARADGDIAVAALCTLWAHSED